MDLNTDWVNISNERGKKQASLQKHPHFSA